MCGIAGIIGVSRELAEPALARMRAAIDHRGPDDRETVFIDSKRGVHPLGFAHTRLAIIDTSPAGRQPMQDAGGAWITFNGEIYNFAQGTRRARARRSRLPRPNRHGGHPSRARPLGTERGQSPPGDVRVGARRPGGGDVVAVPRSARDQAALLRAPARRGAPLRIRGSRARGRRTGARSPPGLPGGGGELPRAGNGLRVREHRRRGAAASSGELARRRLGRARTLVQELLAAPLRRGARGMDQPQRRGGHARDQTARGGRLPPHRRRPARSLPLRRRGLERRRDDRHRGELPRARRPDPGHGVRPAAVRRVGRGRADRVRARDRSSERAPHGRRDAERHRRSVPRDGPADGRRVQHVLRFEGRASQRLDRSAQRAGRGRALRWLRHVPRRAPRRDDGAHGAAPRRQARRRGRRASAARAQAAWGDAAR